MVNFVVVAVVSNVVVTVVLDFVAGVSDVVGVSVVSKVVSVAFDVVFAAFK